MATMVCRGLQSCLDPHLSDQRTFIFPPFELPLKHPSISLIDSDQTHILNPSPPAGIPNSGAGDGGWSLLQSLAPPASKQESVYVHPLTKRFNPTGLSEKSLNLCTENLGNETGSDIIENTIFSPEIDGEDFHRKWEKKPHFNSNLHSSSHRLPPPLTTIRETESFRVTPHREEGRLIIAAVKSPSRAPCFLAERSGGRLRLCFAKTEESEEADGGDMEVGDEMETGNDHGKLNVEKI